MTSVRDIEPHLLDVWEASKRYGLPGTWFYARTAAGTIPHLKIGKYVRFDPDVLDEWFANQSRHDPNHA